MSTPGFELLIEPFIAYAARESKSFLRIVNVYKVSTSYRYTVVIHISQIQKKIISST